MAEQLLRTNQSIDLNSKNIAVQAHTIQPYLFAGINCTSWMGVNQTVLICIKNSYGRSADRGQVRRFIFSSIEYLSTADLNELFCDLLTLCKGNSFYDGSYEKSRTNFERARLNLAPIV